MKMTLVAVAMLVTSAQLFAHINKIKAKNVTCSHLQNKIHHEKALFLKTKFLLFQTKTLVYAEDVAEARCPEYSTYDGGQYREEANVKTKDVESCYIGYYCHSYPNSQDTTDVIVDRDDLGIP